MCVLSSMQFWSLCGCEWLLLQRTDRKFPAPGSLLAPSYSTAHSTPLTTALQRVSMTLSFQSDDCVDWLSRIVLRLAVFMLHDSLRSLPDCLVYQQSVVLMFRRKYSESMVWQRLSLTQHQTPSVKGEIGELCITHLYVASIWKPPGHSRSHREIMKQTILTTEHGVLCWEKWVSPQGLLFLLSTHIWGFPGGSAGKEPGCKWETQEMEIQFLGQKDPLEEGMVTHPRVLAWRIHGQRSLGGCRPWVTQSWTRLKRLNTHAHTSTRLVPIFYCLEDTGQGAVN